MRNDALATVLGTSLAHASAQEVVGLQAAVGEIAHHLHSVSGPPAAEAFLAKVRSSSLRLLQAGVDLHGPTSRASVLRSDVVRALTEVEATMGGSTSPSL